MSSEARQARPRTALVTGAAARLGAAIATRLHERGCTVLLHYNGSHEAAEALAERLDRLRPGSVCTAQADLSRPNEVERLAREARAALGGVDVLVNNASRFYPTTVGSTAAWQWEDLVDSNLRGPYFLVQALAEDLARAGGAVVNLLDVHAERPMRGHAVYSISKAGLLMMTRALALELGPEIRVNGVAPGAILWPEPEPGDAQKAALLDRVVLGRVGHPDDIASAVAYLALDAPYVTGQVLAVDGGRSLNL